MRRLLRRLRWPCGSVVALVLLWGVGLGWFIRDGLRETDDRGVATDAIVVLTGGRLRLESGIDLLEAGKARKLFISGVNQRVHLDELLRVFGPLPASASCCIVIGHDADNTFGNARETADWMRREGFRSLRVVTSWYHMPRSRLEFARAMPEVKLVSHPVFPLHPGGANWDERGHAASLVIGEYHKYLAALALPAATRLAPWLVPAETGGDTVAARNVPASPSGSTK